LPKFLATPTGSTRVFLGLNVLFSNQFSQSTIGKEDVEELKQLYLGIVTNKLKLNNEVSDDMMLFQASVQKLENAVRCLSSQLKITSRTAKLWLQFIDCVVFKYCKISKGLNEHLTGPSIVQLCQRC